MYRCMRPLNGFLVSGVGRGGGGGVGGEYIGVLSSPNSDNLEVPWRRLGGKLWKGVGQQGGGWEKRVVASSTGQGHSVDAHGIVIFALFRGTARSSRQLTIYSTVYSEEEKRSPGYILEYANWWRTPTVLACSFWL